MARTQVASGLLKDTIRNAPAIRKALRGERPLQKDVTNALGSAPREQIVRALVLAAREYGYYHKAGSDNDAMEHLLREVSRRQAEDAGTKAAMNMFLEAFPDTQPASPVPTFKAEGDAP